MRIAYGAERLIFIGDRGMLPGHVRVTIDGDKELPVDYITALRHGETADLIDDVDHPVQLGLFDKDNLAEVEHEGKRYVLCFNPLKLDEDRATRERLMEKTREKLEMIKRNGLRFFVRYAARNALLGDQEECRSRELEAREGYCKETSSMVEQVGHGAFLQR